MIEIDDSVRRAAVLARPKTEVVLGIDHPEYRHMTVLAEPARMELAGDFG